MNITDIKFNRYSTLPWTHIIIHHSATVDGDTYDWNAIDKYHKNVQGWREIGYHFGVEKVDGAYKYCIGRSLASPGAHTFNENDKAIGICVVGNYDTKSPDNEQYVLLSDLCRHLMSEFNIPIENIHGHFEFSPKTCPGYMFDMDVLKMYIKNNGSVVTDTTINIT